MLWRRASISKFNVILVRLDYCRIGGASGELDVRDQVVGRSSSDGRVIVHRTDGPLTAGRFSDYFLCVLTLAMRAS